MHYETHTFPGELPALLTPSELFPSAESPSILRGAGVLNRSFYMQEKRAMAQPMLSAILTTPPATPSSLAPRQARTPWAALRKR